MDRLVSHRNKQPGFTLIGVLIAMIILTGTFVVFSRFIATRDQGVLLGRQTMVAASLAREGLELVRAVRDSNHLTDPKQPWMAGICDGPSASFAIDPARVRDAMPPLFSSNGQLWRTPQGEWTHSSDGNAPTEYSRVMTVDCATIDEQNAEAATVTATVTWEYQQQLHSVVLKEKLFNWLPMPTPTP